MAIDKDWETFMKKSSVRINNMLMWLTMNIHKADVPRAGESICCVAHVHLIRRIRARSWIRLI